MKNNPEMLLVENYFNDLKGKTIDKFARAQIIQNYLEEKNISQREFARRFGFNKSTVEDWLLLSKIDKDYYEDLLNKGYTKTHIYRLLRENKSKELTSLSALDKTLDLCIQKLSSSASLRSKSIYTKEKLDLLKKAIRTYEFRLEKEK